MNCLNLFCFITVLLKACSSFHKHQHSIKIFVLLHPHSYWSTPGDSDGKESACSVGDLDSIPELGRCPGEGNGNPLQYSCLENPMNGGAWSATVHGIAKSQTRLGDFSFFLSFTHIDYYDS